MSAGKVMLVEDDAALRLATLQTLDLAGYEVEAHDNARDALKRLSPHFSGVIVTDIRMPGMDGLELFARLRALDEDLPILLITGHGDVPMAVRALQQGAFDFIAKPFATEQLIASVARAQAVRTRVLADRRLQQRLAPDEVMIGDCDAMQRLRARLADVARTRLDVLIEGEAGVGKRLAARALHRQSLHMHKAFVAVDAMALGSDPNGLAAALAAAAGGTLLVEGMDALSLPQQAFLAQAMAQRSGPDAQAAPGAADVRLVATACPNLEAAVTAGRFRSDLFYQLAAARLAVPPLRDRRDDIGPLFAHFQAEAAAQTGRAKQQLSPGQRQHLLEHEWPGNVRELRNHAFAVALGLVDGNSQSGLVTTPERTLAAQVDDYEQTLITQALRACEGQVTRVAEVLGIPRKTLYDKFRKYQIDPILFRSKS